MTRTKATDSRLGGFLRRPLPLTVALTLIATILNPMSSAFAATATHLVVSTQPSGAANGVNLTTQPVMQLQDGSGVVDTADSTTQVTASIASGSGTLSGTTTVTASAGVVTFTTLKIVGTVGSFTLTFTPNTALGPVTSASFTLTYGTATALAISTQPVGAGSGFTLTTQPVVRVVDSSGNTVANSTATVVATIASGSGTISSATNTIAAASGVVTYSGLFVTASTPGSFTLTFGSGTLTPVTSAPFIVAGAPAALAITTQPPASAVSGVALTTQPVVRIVDASGNTVLGQAFSVTATIASGTGTPSGNSATTTSGVATFTNLAISGATGSVTLLFTPSYTGFSVSTITSAAISLTAFGTATGSAISTQPSGAISGVALTSQPVIRIVDAGGNTVTTSTANVVATIASGSGTLSGTTTVAAVSGVATFTNLMITGTSGSYTLTFTPASLAAVTSVSFPVTGPASQIAINAGNNQLANVGTAVTTAPSVIVKDASNSPVSGVSVTFAVATGSGSLTAGTAVTNASGIATVGSWTLGAVAGSNTLTATSGTLTGSPITFTATGVGPATQIAANAGNGQTANVSTAVSTPPSVIVKDVGNNPVSGVSVTFAVATGVGSLTGATAVTNASGIATVGSWTLGAVAGSNTLTATSGTLTGSPITFTATGAGAATQIAINAGNNQSATVGTAVTTPLSVVVKDASNNPVSGVSVSFVVASGGGSLASSGTVTTNSSGVATAPAWTLGATPGTNTLTATSGTLTGSPLTFTATGNAIVATQIAVNGGNNQSATVGAAVNTAPSVVVKDASNNPVSGVSVTFAIATGGGSVTGGTAVTNASGIATVGSWTLGSTAGSNTLTATSGTLTGSPVTFTATGTAGTPTAAAITTQPTGAVSGVAFTTQPVVRIVDSTGNTVTSSSVNVLASIASGTGTLSGTTTVAAVNGIATFTNLTITGTAGSFTLTFAPTGLTPVTSASFNLTAASSGGGSSTPAPTTNTTTATASSTPLTVTPTATTDVPFTHMVDHASGASFKVLFNATGGAPVEIQVTVPSSAISKDVTVSIAPSVTPGEVAAGFVSLKVTATDSTGTSVSRFSSPLTLNLGKVATDTTPAFSQDDLVWNIVARLTGTTLPDGVNEGYYISPDGSLMILTRHLTYFGVKRIQVPPTLAALTSSLAVGKNTQLSIAGGSGTGDLIYATSTPSVCSVSGVGVVTGLKAGTCTLTVAKNGDGTYLNSSSAPIDLTFLDLVPKSVAPAAAPVALPNEATKGLTTTNRLATTKSLSVARLGSTWSVELDFGATFGGRILNLQIHSPGTKSYKTLGFVRLNKAGAARVNRSNITSGSNLRVVANYRNLISTIVR